MTHVKRILITADPQETRVAIVEGGKPVEAYIERRGRRSIVGNIYLGRVDAVLPGMEAAFVDIGLEKNGFLYVDEIMLPELDDRERRKKRIQELIQSGQEVLVQVTKDPMGTKGARLTMEVSLAGRFMVIAPGGEGIGVSRKLPDDERVRLRDLIKRVQAEEDAGMIVRTAAAGASVEELERDVRLLEALWQTTRGHAERSKGAAPALVYTEPDLPLQTIRDDFRADVSEVVVDDEKLRSRILDYVNRTSPELAERIKPVFRGKRPLFSRYEIDQTIRSTLKRRVDLPSGGYLIFDYGEAFTVIDVNTGRFTGKKKLEDTIVKNNLEAAVEVVRQLRLRDIGGIIVIDFIDMSSAKNRDAVLGTLQKELEKDRSKVYVVDVSPLGLVEMTRKNIADGVREILTRTCEICEGTGRVLSEESWAIDHARALHHHLKESKAEAYHVALNAEVASILIGPGGNKLREMERETGRYFNIEGVEGVPLGFREIRAEGARSEIEADSVPVEEGQELVVRIDEPHMYVEQDAIARLESGYVVVVAGSGPYLGSEQRVRIERATRTSAYAALLDVQPASPVEEPEVVDRESDILEPERQVGERVDIEGRVKRQRKRAEAEKRRDQRQGRKTAPKDADGAAAAGDEDDAAAEVDGELEPAAEGAAADGTTPARRRRRRGGRGRRKPAAAGVNGNGAAAAEEVAEEELVEAAETVAVAASGEGNGDADADPTVPARRKRRRGGRGRRRPAGAGAAASAEGQSESAPVAVAVADPPAADKPARPPRQRAPRQPRTDAPEAPPAPAPAPAAATSDERKAATERKRGLIGRLLGRGDS